MKVLLLKDVYKLGHAGDVKKVADGYGRNFLLPQGLATLATPGALRQVDRIRQQAAARRAAQNEELSAISQQLNGLIVSFAAKAGETGKLYGSITNQELAQAIEKKTGYPAKRQQLDMQPIRGLGEHLARLRLTMDLVPEIKVVVYREGEADPTIITGAPPQAVQPEVVLEQAPPESTAAEPEESEETLLVAGDEEIA